MTEKTYAIAEIFYSIQGEGAYAGTPAVFVRLAGCNLACAWCDTDFKVKRHMTAKEINKEIAELLINITAGPLASTEAQPSMPILVFTGGEPTLQLVDDQMVGQGSLIKCIETNGTGHVPWWIDFVTLSPKFGYSTLDDIKMARINEIKVVLEEGVDPEYWRPLVDQSNPMSRYIQPCSENFQPAIDYVKQHPEWKLSLQTQKMINID